MKKIKSLFKRDYKGDRQVYNEVVPESAWVLSGEGKPTAKIDGTSCCVKEGKLFKRYDRRLKKRYKNYNSPFGPGNFIDPPDGWVACQEADLYSGHWPGWLPVGDGPEDKYHREAFAHAMSQVTALQAYRDHHGIEGSKLLDGTYELVGPKVQSNPHQYSSHVLVKHGDIVLEPPSEYTFEAIREWVGSIKYEGVVWHHPDGRKVKLKRRDFGFPWPL